MPRFFKPSRPVFGRPKWTCTEMRVDIMVHLFLSWGEVQAVSKSGSVLIFVVVVAPFLELIMQIYKQIILYRIHNKPVISYFNHHIFDVIARLNLMHLC